MKNYKERSWPLYNEMLEAFGEEHATGVWVETSKEIRTSRAKRVVVEDPLSPYISSTEHLGLDDLPPNDVDHVHENESPSSATNGPSINNQPSVGSNATCDSRHKQPHG